MKMSVWIVSCTLVSLISGYSVDSGCTPTERQRMYSAFIEMQAVSQKTIYKLRYEFFKPEVFEFFNALFPAGSRPRVIENLAKLSFHAIDTEWLRIYCNDKHFELQLGGWDGHRWQDTQSPARFPAYPNTITGFISRPCDEDESHGMTYK
ncbi:MAG: hypothetical protein M1833_004242 [Piccolia ochrophora]|nr:MAG: hypothetical protein M1833_004242 [Piccolia ochrophora]